MIGGGQAGLAAAYALRRGGRPPVVLEAGEEPVGSWPSYYDSLTLFSPARYSSLPGMPFPGDPDHYPHRDEVVDYLRRYAKNLDADIRTGHRVDAGRPDQRRMFTSIDGDTVTWPDGHTEHVDTILLATGMAARLRLGDLAWSRPRRGLRRAATPSCGSRVRLVLEKVAAQGAEVIVVRTGW